MSAMALSRAELVDLFIADRDLLRAVLTRRVGIDHADDLLNDLFLRLDRIADRLPTSSDARLYLLRMAQNIGIDHFRADGRRIRLLEGLARLYEDAVEDDAHARAEGRQQLRLLEEGINRLPERQQTVLRLSRLQGQTHPQIARILGISLRTVEGDMAAALKALRRTLPER